MYKPNVDEQLNLLVSTLAILFNCQYSEIEGIVDDVLGNPEYWRGAIQIGEGAPGAGRIMLT